MRTKVYSVTLVLMTLVLTATAQVKYKVSGRAVPGTMTCQLFDLDTKRVIKEIKVVKGRFSCEGEMPLNSLLGVGSKDFYMTFFVDGTPVEVDFNGRTLKGSPLNTLLRQCDERLDSLMLESYAPIQAYEQEWTTASNERKAEIRKMAEALMEKAGKGRMALLGEYAHTLVPAAYLPSIFTQVEFTALGEFMNPEAPYYCHPAMEKVIRYYELQLRKQPGNPFIDAVISDMDGNLHSLSEWCGKGNYVLIDFWASWCGPCRREMPNVVEGYVKYHKKGYEVIGISLDEKEAAWKNAVRNLGMDWIQLSDLKGWKCEAAALYGVKAIPSNVLIDGEGHIVALDLRGEQLADCLREIYGY